MDKFITEINESSSPSPSITRIRANISDNCIMMLNAKSVDILNENSVKLFKNFCYLLHCINIPNMHTLDTHLFKAAKVLNIHKDVTPADLFDLIFKKSFTDFNSVTLYFLKILVKFCNTCEARKITSVKIYILTMAVFLYVYSWFILYPTITKNWGVYNVEIL